MFLLQLFNETVSFFEKSGIETREARIETGLLFESVFNVCKKDLIISPHLIAAENLLEKFNKLVEKRINEKISVQYLINKAFFMKEEFYVDENVLIPRPETEILAEQVISLVENKMLQRSCKIIDVGTGSGCIAVSLAIRLNNAEIYACDISENALKIAEKNAKNLGVINKIKFIQSDILVNIDEKFDIVVSNPPYISVKEQENLQIEVRKHEPPLALFVEDEEGISFYKRLAEQAYPKTKEGGYIAVEVGIGQAGLVREIFENFGYREIQIISDLGGIERIVTGKKQ